MTNLAEPMVVAAGNPRVYRTPRAPLEQFERGAEGREALEAFIAATFLKNYGARLDHFSDTLVGVRDPDGAWTAALGYSIGSPTPFFVEHYLDEPIELEIGRRLGQQVDRRQVVEVGNLAAIHSGAARALIVGTTTLLERMGLQFVTFTATTSLLNSFGRLRLRPQELTRADPARLPDGGRNWGSYYDTQPHVMFGDIHYGYSELARLAARTHHPAD